MDTETTTGAQNFTVPEAYQGKPWVEKITTAENPSDALWKTLDNAQSLIGKKSIPSAEAPDAEWTAFYNQLGRPEKPDAYTLPEVEGLPEGVDLTESKKSAMSIMHEAGITQKQAEKLWKLYMGKQIEEVNGIKAKSAEEQARLDKEFDDVSAKVFGDKYESKSAAAQEMIKSFVPEELRPAIDEVANNPKALAAVIAALSSASEEIAKVKAEYGKEDTLNGGGSQTTSTSLEDMRKELAALRVSAIAKDFTHPDHKKTKERIDALSLSVQRSLNK